MARNVVISGGGTGIGLAAARAFAAGGDRVLLLGRRAEVLEKAGVPGRARTPADLTEPAEVRGVAGFVEREFGAVDVLVHSAGAPGCSSRRPDVRSARAVRAQLDRELPAQHPDRRPAHRGAEARTRRGARGLVGETFTGRRDARGACAATLHWRASPAAESRHSAGRPVNGAA